MLLPDSRRNSKIPAQSMHPFIHSGQARARNFTSVNAIPLSQISIMTAPSRNDALTSIAGGLA